MIGFPVLLSSIILPQPNRIFYDNPQKQLPGRLVQLQVNIALHFAVLRPNGEEMNWEEVAEYKCIHVTVTAAFAKANICKH